MMSWVQISPRTIRRNKNKIIYLSQAFTENMMSTYQPTSKSQGTIIYDMQTFSGSLSLFLTSLLAILWIIRCFDDNNEH